MRATARLGLVTTVLAWGTLLAAMLVSRAPEDASAAPQPATAIAVTATAPVLPKRLKKHRMWLLEIGVFKLCLGSVTGRRSSPGAVNPG
jgi:hypothetical protein